MRAKRAVKGAGRAWCGGYHGFLAALSCLASTLNQSLNQSVKFVAIQAREGPLRLHTSSTASSSLGTCSSSFPLCPSTSNFVDNIDTTFTQ